MSAAPSAFLSLIRPMREGDLSSVVAIEQAAYDFPWTRGIFRDCLRVGYECAVHLADNRVAGYLILSCGAGEAHVLNVAVDPRYQARGFGRRLLRRALRRADRLGAEWVFLEVRPSNIGAVHLYRSEGFRPIGRRRGYYPVRGGREDALVLRRDLRDGAPI